MFGFSVNRAAMALIGASLVATSAAQADVLTEWNEEWLDTIRAVGGPPCPLAHNTAMLFVGVFDAVNSIDRAYDPYLSFIRFHGPANKQAAAAAAAHKILVHNYPARTAIYDALYTSQITLIANGASDMELAPWLLIFPSAVMVITLMSFNFIGDGLRDAIDPKDR